MFHLNDAVYARGSGKDTHAALMTGKIWKGTDFKENGLNYIMKFAKFNQMPMILERPKLAMLKTDYALLAKK
jgi:endonuclease IV